MALPTIFNVGQPLDISRGKLQMKSRWTWLINKKLFWVLHIQPPNIPPPTPVGRITRSGLKKHAILMMKCLFPERFFWVSFRLCSNYSCHSNLALTNLMVDHYFHQSNVGTSWFKSSFPVQKIQSPYWFMVDHIVGIYSSNISHLLYLMIFPSNWQTSHSSHVSNWPLHKFNISPWYPHYW